MTVILAQRRRRRDAVDGEIQRQRRTLWQDFQLLFHRVWLKNRRNSIYVSLSTFWV